LARLLPSAERKSAIRAPWGKEASLHAEIRKLRDAGEIVIQSLPGHENDQDEFDCDRALVLENGNWLLKKLG
jgi:ATP phosphoribosyltransferase regulatory subunit